MWDPPRLGIKPTSPSLAGDLFNTEPPGKPLPFFFAQLSTLKHHTMLYFIHETPFFLFNFSIEAQLIYNVLPVSTIQQSDSVIYKYKLFLKYSFPICLS